MSRLHDDATAECQRCGMPMLPLALEGREVRLECANRHQLRVALPADPGLRRRIDNWIAKRAAQLHAQREHWEGNEETP